MKYAWSVIFLNVHGHAVLLPRSVMKNLFSMGVWYNPRVSTSVHPLTHPQACSNCSPSLSSEMPRLNQQGLNREQHKPISAVAPWLQCGVESALSFACFLTVMSVLPPANTDLLANSSVIRISRWIKRHPNICRWQTNTTVFICFWSGGAEWTGSSRLKLLTKAITLFKCSWGPYCVMWLRCDLNITAGNVYSTTLSSLYCLLNQQSFPILFLKNH